MKLHGDGVIFTLPDDWSKQATEAWIATYEKLNGEKLEILPYSISPSALQSVAEEVHLAIKLLDDALRLPSNGLMMGTASYFKLRIEAVRDVLRPVALTLAPYLPNYKEPKEEFAEQDLQDSNHETEDDPGYLSGNDEQGYSARHA